MAVIEKWLQRPQVVIYDENISPQLSVFVARELSKIGFFPISISFGNTQCESTNCVNSMTLEPLEIRIELMEDKIRLRIGNSVAVFDSEDDFRTHFVKNFIEMTNLEGHIIPTVGETGNNVPETVVYEPKTSRIFTVVPVGLPLLVVPDYVNFIPAVVTVDGSFYKNGVLYTSEKNNIQVDSLPILYNGYSILTGNYILNLRTGKKEFISSPPIFSWDKFLIYADGSITDTTLAWKLKVSNAPLDFLLIDNTLFLLDVTEGVYVVNLKSRKVSFLGNFNGALFLTLDRNLGKVILKTLNGDYVLTENNATKVDSGFEYVFSNKEVYPYFTGVENSGSGYFYRGVFLGDSIFYMSVSRDNLNIVTEVGTWQVTLKKRD
ncbi:hypothetical protein [Fervidobacterium islandicum]|uniref:hypothetical protein n=1 Tax=Fervidobacterium islandicum TaxID=2423 RepID=UPI003A782436